MSEEKLITISYENKNCWTTKKPVEKSNMILEQDWNKFKIIDQCEERINTVSSTIENVFSGSNKILSNLILSCKQVYPTSSFLSTINGLYDDVKGISTIKINDEVYTDSFSAYYLSSDATLVNSFNGASGNINCITTIKVNTEQFPKDDDEDKNIVNLGNFFTQNELCVSSINSGYIGNVNYNANIITSVVLMGAEYNTLNRDFQLKFDDKFLSSAYKKEENITKAIVPTPIEIGENNIIIDNTTSGTIINKELYNLYSPLSTELAEGVEKIISGVGDWISITDQNHNNIQPTSVNLSGDVLTITSPSAGTLYYISKITV